MSIIHPQIHANVKKIFADAEINKDVQNIAKHVTLNIDDKDYTISLNQFYVSDDTKNKEL